MTSGQLTRDIGVNPRGGGDRAAEAAAGRGTSVASVMAQNLRVYGLSPFGKLALANAFSTIGDTILTVSLAGSIFFSSLDPNAARSKVILFLVLTMAPFAVVAPVLGPALDRTRGGRRLYYILGYFTRALLLFLMIFHYDDIWLYPLAFGCLVLSKGHSIAKSSLLPAMVGDTSELVHANSQLAIITALASIVGAIPAAILKLIPPGTPWQLVAGVIVFLVGGVLATQIPKVRTSTGPADPVEVAELAAPTILFAVTGMAVIRGGVGFMTFFAAFWLKGNDAPLYQYGLLLAISAVGGLFGNWIAPYLNRVMQERTMLVASILAPAVAALFAARYGGIEWLCVASLTMAIVSSTGQLAYESIVQKEAPEAARGRNFARFETRFQIVWVLGGLAPVVLSGYVADKAELFVLAIVMGGGGLFYLGTMFRKEPTTPRPARPTWGARLKARLGRAAPLSASAPSNPANTKSPFAEVPPRPEPVGDQDRYPGGA